MCKHQLQQKQQWRRWQQLQQSLCSSSSSKNGGSNNNGNNIIVMKNDYNEHSNINNVTLKKCNNKWMEKTRQTARRWLRTIKVLLYELYLEQSEQFPRTQRRLKKLEIGGRMETIKTRTLQKSARILTTFLESWGDLLSLVLK